MPDFRSPLSQRLPGQFQRTCVPVQPHQADRIGDPPETDIVILSVVILRMNVSDDCGPGFRKREAGRFPSVFTLSDSFSCIKVVDAYEMIAVLNDQQISRCIKAGKTVVMTAVMFIAYSGACGRKSDRKEHTSELQSPQ